VAHTRRRYLPAAVALAVVVIAALSAWRLYWPPALYRVTILPSLGDQDTLALVLNDQGLIVGAGRLGDEAHLFLWDRQRGSVQDLGAANAGTPLMINNGGQISGTMLMDDKSSQAFLWEPGKGRTMLGTLGGKASIAFAMNDRGQIVGESHDVSGSQRAFLWDRAAGMRELKAPDGSLCRAVSINDAGQILVSVGSSQWLLLDPNGLISLHMVPSCAWPCRVNNGSCVVGIDASGGSQPYLVFVDGQTTWNRLFPANPEYMSRLNDRNQIAYTQFRSNWWDKLCGRLLPQRSRRSRTESYLWDSFRGRISLNRYVRGTRMFLVQDLSNEGCIAGVAQTKDGKMQPILLEPIPQR